MTHTNVKPFSCSECGQRFRQKSILDKHFLRHQILIDSSLKGESNEGKRGYTCENNIQESSINLSIIKSEQNSDNEQEGKNIPTKEMDKTLHISLKKCTDNMFSCSTCNYNFENNEILQKHILFAAHINAKSNNTDLENEEKSNLHQLSQKRLPYTCSKCDYQVTKKFLLDQMPLHLNETSNEKT